jgi:hypothetical protein
MKPEFSREDVLNAFAVEPNYDRATLERYLRDYPEYAIELAHLSYQLSRTDIEPAPLSTNDRAAIDEAWKFYSSSAAAGALNIFVCMSVTKSRELARVLDVPRQVITAFRERKVIVSSIPGRILARIANELNATVEQVKAALSLPPEPACVRSHKADEKPVSAGPATFEQLLIDAQVPADKRAELMAGDK